jgi:hypothetical protein
MGLAERDTAAVAKRGCDISAAERSIANRAWADRALTPAFRVDAKSHKAFSQPSPSAIADAAVDRRDCEPVRAGLCIG